MAGKIFINYRRDDDAAGAARVRDGLASKFGKANLFIDVDNLFAGQRFDEELARALVTCDVLVAVIGRHWMDLLKAKIASGGRDHVREEIAAALQRRIVVIPVRVGREGQLPPLPRVEDLPPDISDLVLHQKHDVTHERFGRGHRRTGRSDKGRAPIKPSQICGAALLFLLWPGGSLGLHWHWRDGRLDADNQLQRPQ